MLWFFRKTTLEKYELPTVGDVQPTAGAFKIVAFRGTFSPTIGDKRFR